MPITEIRGGQIKDGTVKRPDLNTNEVGSAVVRKVTIAGRGLKLEYDGADAGTGDVTISVINPDLIFKQFLLNGASQAMNVNGSVTPVEFAYSADGTVDTYLQQVVIELQDGSIDWNLFGALAALTNGFDLKIDQGGTTKTLINAAKTTYQLIRDLGGGTFDLLEKSTGGNDDSILIRMPLYDALLAGGSADKIYATVSDDLTGLTRFNAYVIAGREP